MFFSEVTFHLFKKQASREEEKFAIRLQSNRH
jgi:hypothetical protein